MYFKSLKLIFLVMLLQSLIISREVTASNIQIDDHSLIPAAIPLADPPTDLFFSEYVEGSSNNKALEIYNGTGSAINLTTGNYVVHFTSYGPKHKDHHERQLKRYYED